MLLGLDQELLEEPMMDGKGGSRTDLMKDWMDGLGSAEHVAAHVPRENVSHTPDGIRAEITHRVTYIVSVASAACPSLNITVL